MHARHYYLFVLHRETGHYLPNSYYVYIIILYVIPRGRSMERL